ncbi:PhoX family protein [Sinimarinibacterium thermocellulolyticum]|uniref:PhoX family phosphatase n=1 Tax=Sinimarinibacterium thermocellulolyticum TaxID=3170016 RepID=A0ABV2AAN3_9GAMM
MSTHPDEIHNHSANTRFEDVLSARLQRRDVLRGGVTLASATTLGSLALVGCSDDDDEAGAPRSLGFAAVAKNRNDAVTLPAGYSATVLYAFGDPIDGGTPDFRNDGTDTASDRRAGDQHDGMAYFGLSDAGQWARTRSDRGLLAINHEQVLDAYLHVAGPTQDVNGNRPQAEVDKEMNAHGVSIIEVRREVGSNRMSYVRTSPFNRRITPFTEMDITGPARGSARLFTPFSPNGTRTRGTLNNCAHGHTPWGTYLTCEENWFSYWKRGDDVALRNAADNAQLARNGLSPNSAGFSYRKWDTVDADVYRRFNITAQPGGSATTDYRNEANTFGYIVEIDPFDPDSRPQKRTALGRIVHEGCWAAPAIPGRPLVFYMGDDARFEYIYKFVSAENWDPADAERSDRLAVGAKYLDHGTLYVAKFNADGSGEWIALVHNQNGLDINNTLFPFASQADVCIATRLAADAVGATKMDRPEWAAVNPVNGEVYLTLTNNTRRTQQGQADAANPRLGNANGHIIRWRESGGVQEAMRFDWDIFLFGAASDADPATTNVSGLTDANDFSSPDGLWFDARGVLWIQTDDGVFPGNDRSNNQMLAALPGRVGDGVVVTTTNAPTIAGAKATGDTVRRFLVGPRGCEITGVDMTPDYRTMFVNVQHPGEDGTLDQLDSTWPNPSRNALQTGAAGQRPRSATIVITRDDGGPIGV